MKKWNKRIRKENTKIFILLAVMAPLLALSGCGKEKAPQEEGTPGEEFPATGIAYETAQDSEIDFSVLKGENPDIFGWLYVPGTDIDCPILQSVEADDFYTSHNAYGEEDARGALYTELANLTDMCDFNTVIHGSRQEGGSFSGLHRFADPDYFADHDKAYIYLEGNLLTYEIFAAYERENTSLIRTYDLTYAAG